MSANELVLDATRREVFGKGAMRKLRVKGLIPGVIYGLHDPVSIQVNEREALRMVNQLHGTTKLVKLRLSKADGGGQSDHHALLKEVQTTPVGQRVVHMDFNEVRTDLQVKVLVGIRTHGVPVGVTFGGTMQVIMHEVMVECLPTSIPEYLEVDVSGLAIGNNLHAKDLALPKGVVLASDPGATVLVITGRAKEEEAHAEVAEGAEEAPKAAE
ncbi:MAG: 50S ribosomal protein L25 [Deltaproteobacteria bacterium]|nr:50S ribosomal protein L25 [Deltaproteobacteria bacterium]